MQSVYHLSVDALIDQGVVVRPLAERLTAHLRDGGLMVFAGNIGSGKTVLMNALVRAVSAEIPVTVVGNDWGVADAPNVTHREPHLMISGDAHMLITAAAPDAGLYVLEEARLGELVAWITAAQHGGMTCIATPLEHLGQHLCYENREGQLAQALQRRLPLWVVSLIRTSDHDDPQIIAMHHLYSAGQGSPDIRVDAERFARDLAGTSALRDGRHIVKEGSPKRCFAEHGFSLSAPLGPGTSSTLRACIIDLFKEGPIRIVDGIEDEPPGEPTGQPNTPDR